MKTQKEYALRQQAELYQVYLQSYSNLINQGYTHQESTRGAVFRQSKYLEDVADLEMWFCRNKGKEKK